MGFGVREHREATKLRDGSIYVGSWSIMSSNCRQGRGVQVYADGSLYEGYWLNDKPNYYGRFVHAGGEMYQGEWLND